MPNTGNKGIPGLQGWRDLSAEERQAWLDKNPKAKDAPLYLVEKAYDASRFIDEFGMDALKRYDKDTRNQMMQERFVNKAFEDKFGDDEAFDTLNGMTTEGKLSLLNNDKFDRANEKLERIQNVKGNIKSAVLGDKEDDPVASFAYNALTPFKFLDPEAMRQETRDKVITETLAEDNARKQKSVESLSKRYLAASQNAYNRGELSEAQINETFNEIVNGSEKTGLPGSRYYQTFKDTKYFKDFNLDDKMNVIAQFTAMRDAYGAYDAVDSLDRNMQSKVSKEQGWARQLGNTVLNIGSGSVAYLMQSLMAFDSLSKLGDREAYANFMEGKDKDGNPLPNWWNLKYWDGVDQFGTFSPTEINEARKRGGISTHQLITEPGKEYNAWATVNEGLNMMKFVIPDLIFNKAIGSALGKGARAAGARYTAAGLDRAASTKAGYALGQYINPAVQAFRSGLGISQAYALQTYDQTKDEAEMLVDKQVRKDASDYADSIIASDAGKAGVQNYINSQIQLIRETRPDVPITQEVINALQEQGESMYKSSLMQDYVKDRRLWKNDYDADREQARQAAASASITDFIVEQARMFAAGMTWKNYTFDKGTQQAMKNNFPLTKFGKTSTGDFGITNEKYARAMSVLKPVWGGFESNYFDDVTVAFGKGFGLGKFNNYLAHKYDPENAADTIDTMSEFFTGISAAVTGAKGALTDFQSFYDGLVGALGTVTNVTPRMRNLVSKKAREEFSKGTEDNPLSVAEKINKFINNPLLEAYSLQREQERGLKPSIDAINKTIKDNKVALEDIIGTIGSLDNLTAINDNSTSAREIKDEKTRMAYTLALNLKKWMQDPLMSQVEDVQNAQDNLERYAKGNISQEEISTFLARPGNKSVAELPNAEQVAAERIRNNAIQLINIQRELDNVMSDLEETDFYKTALFLPNGREHIQDVAEQLAYMRIAGQDWQKRFSEVEKSISGSTVANNSRNRTALYGSRKGWLRAVDIAQQAVDDLQESYDVEKSAYDAAMQKRTKGISREDKRAALAGLKIAYEETGTRLQLAKEELSRIKSEEVKDGEVLPVLSKEEILNLNPEERAFMLKLDKKNQLQNYHEYSKEQQRVIDEVVNDLNMRESGTWQKVQDAAELHNMIRDNARAYTLITQNPEAAVGMVDNLKAERQTAVQNRLALRTWDKQDERMNNAQSDEELVALAKNTVLGQLERYIKRNPNKKGILGGIPGVLNVRNDAVGVIEKLFDNEQDRANWSKAVNDMLADDSVRTEEDAMRVLEENVDAQELEQNRTNLDRILKGLEDLKHQRNATVIQNRAEAEKERKRVAEEKKFNNDGANFGVSGYHKNDVAYNKKSGASYTVISFGKDAEGNNTVTIKSQGNGHSRTISAERFNNEMTKESPRGKEKVGTPTQTQTQTETQPQVQQEPVQQGIQQTGEGETVSLFDEQSAEQTEEPVMPAEVQGEQSQTESSDDTLTDDGAVVQPTEEEQSQIDAAQAKTQVVSPATVDPYEEPVQDYVQDTGTMPGNILYEYDLYKLGNNAFKDAKRRANDPARGQLLGQFFEWLDNNNIKLQEVIDNEFGRIIQDHPDTKVRFMKIRSNVGNLQSGVILNVIELTPALEKYHNKKLYGDTINVDGKNYLVVGTTGFPKNNTFIRGRFNKLNEKLNAQANQHFNANQKAAYYVSDMYSEVSDMLNGKYANALPQDTEAKYRTLTELINDPARNPRGYKSLDDMIFGVSYNNGLVTSKSTVGLRLYSPKTSRVGNTFVFIETANGAWVPLQIKTTTLNEIRDGRLKDIITGLMTDLTSNDYETRKDAARRLFGKKEGYLFTDNQNNILVGNEQYNNITVVRNGVKTSFDVANIDRAAFLDLAMNTPFIIKTRMATFQDSARLAMYDEAGALTTNSATLGTVAQTYNLWDVGEDGKPIKKELDFSKETVSSVRTTYQATTIGGKVYRYNNDNGNQHYYDESGREIPQVEENRQLITNIHYGIIIQNRNLAPIPDRGNTGNYYIIRNTTDNPLAVHKDRNGVVTVMNPAQSAKVIQRATDLELQRQRNEAAKAEYERLKRAEDMTLETARQTGQGETADILTSLVEDTPVAVQSKPQQTKSQPIQRAEQVVSTMEERPSEGKITENGKKSFSELKKDAEGSGESVNFATIWRNKYEEISNALEQITGKRPNNRAEAIKMIEDAGLSTLTTKSETLEEILKNCREFKK